MSASDRDSSDKAAPPGADPAAGHNPGYAENQPRDREDAQKAENGKRPNPDVGGLGRDSENDADPVAKD